MRHIVDCLKLWSKKPKQVLPSHRGMVDSYSYSALEDKRSIRLIQILAFDKRSGLLRYSLESFNLEDCPSFTALSYTWALPGGSVDPDEENEPIYGESHKIECRTTSLDSRRSRAIDGYLTITQNLFDALSQLAKSGHKGALWIDAVCINQGDIDERAAQVSLMGEIYSTAMEVIIWLGRDAAGLKDFLWLHKTLLPKLRSREVKAKDADNPELVSALGARSVALWGKRWSAYPLFYAQHRWFYRVWIVQEVSLAQRVVALCGNVVMPWEEMLDMAFFLRSSGWQHHLHVQNELTKRPLGQELVRLGSLQIIFRMGGPEADFMKRTLHVSFGASTAEQRWYAYLGYLISRLRRSRATDPRDMVYGILGLALPFLPKGMDNPITISYSKGVAETYTEVSTLILENVPLLYSLSYVEDNSRRRIDGLPSWVPDYTYPFRPKPLAALGIPADSDDKLPTPQSMGDLYDASLTRHTPVTYPKVMGKFLSITGACFDTISETCTSFLDSGPGILKPYLDICLSLDTIYAPTGQVREEVLWRTWIADFHSTHPAPPNLSVSFHDYVCYCTGSELARSRVSGQTAHTESLRTLRNLDELRQSSGNFDILPSSDKVEKYADMITRQTLMALDSDLKVKEEAHKIHLAIIGQMRAFDRAQSEVVLDRKFYRTERGFFGLGPLSAQPGDEIWVLRGGRVPFILRPYKQKDSRQLFVGETYLHGFMHGEMLTPEIEGKIGPVIVS